MARLRQFVISVSLIACLCACDGPPAPAPREKVSRPATTPSARKPPASAPRVAPEWQSRLPEIDPAQLPQTLAQADAALARGQLERGSSPGPGALELYLAVLQHDPANAQALVGLESALDALLERGFLAMREGRIGDAERTEVMARSLLPGHLDLAAFSDRLANASTAEQLVAKANAAAGAGRFTTPAGSSAADYFAQAAVAFADYAPIEAGRQRWGREILKRAWRSAGAEDFAVADRWLLQSEKLRPAAVDARVMGLRILELRQARTDAVLAEGNASVDRLRLRRAASALAHAERIAAQRSGTDALRARIHLARHYGPFKPGQFFAERMSAGGTGPEMVVIPYGRFVMGAAEADPHRQDNELPQHEVAFRRGFAIARNETTVAEFRRFIASSKYVTTATRAGRSTVYDEKGGVFGEHEGVDWRRDHVGRVASAALPVVHVSLPDALAYARWLSRQTGRRYRLPSEAEFEYVLRAGSNSIYPWGEAPPKRIVGNLPGDGDLSQLGRNWGNPVPGYRDAFWGPAPVRNFPAEPFGTYDMVGNLSEWTLDCWHDSYQRAPVNGSAWVNPGCPARVVRGASWGSSLDQARSASRLSMDTGSSTARLGFRVVREL